MSENINTLKDNKWLAQKLNVSSQTARTLHLKTNIPIIRIGRLIRYDSLEVDRWLSQQMEAAK